MKSKLLTAILEFTDVCISTCNIPQARKLVNEGELILEEVCKYSKLRKIKNLNLKTIFLQ